MNPQLELSHLQGGSTKDAKPGGLGLVQFSIRCPCNAQVVLERCKEVMFQVANNTMEPWPSTEVWETTLPNWFVSTCAPEVSNAESERWLSWWRSLPSEQQAQAVSEKQWTLRAWVYWFQRDQRNWFWWDARIENDSCLQIFLQVDDWPCAMGAFEWLMRASGGLEVVESEG